MNFQTILLILAIICSSFGIYTLYSKFSKKDSRPTVYWLNFKPESEQTLKELATLYESKNDVSVNIVTPKSGEYNSELDKELKKSSPPTLFVVGNKESVKKHEENIYDLKDTKLFGELKVNDYLLYTDDKKVAGIGYCYETFGIIVNEELLEKAGHSISEIKDFASLKTVAEDIHSKAKDLGFDAFTSSGLDSSSSWRFTGHLANLPLYYQSRDGKWEDTPAQITDDYLVNYKNLWDLYILNSAFSPYTKDSIVSNTLNAGEEFGNKKAVFYQNGNWEYDSLVNTYKLSKDKLKMIPFYGGVEGEEKAGLNSGTENYWAVNAKASEKDVNATLDFLYWLVTDSEANKKLSTTFGSMPFKNSVTPDNVFLEQEQQNVNDGKYTMTWAFNYTPNHAFWREAILSKLITYTGEPNEANWNSFKETFVNSWKEQYETLNKQ